MLGDELFRECEDMVDLRSIVEIDRSEFLRLYADLYGSESVDREEMDQAEAVINRFVRRVESLLGSYRVNRPVLEKLLRCDAGRILWSSYMDALHEDIQDCIAGYVEDLYEGKEDEREVLGKIEKSVHNNLSALYHTLNDKESLIEIALVHSL